MNTLLKEWISLFKALLGEMTLLINIFPSFKNLNGPVNHFNSPLYFASREIGLNFLLIFMSHSIVLGTTMPEASTSSALGMRV